MNTPSFPGQGLLTRAGGIARIAALSVALLFALCACELPRPARPQPSPTPPAAAVPSLTPSSTATTTQTTLPAAAVPSLTPSSTATTTQTPLPLTPTPTPSIPSTQRLPTAIALQKQGEYERAVAEYAAVISAQVAPRLAAEALFGLGESYYLQKDYRMALDVFAHLMKNYPQSAQAPAVLFRQAFARSQLGDWQGALEAYQSYAARASAISGYLQMRIAEAYAHLAQDTQAVESYEKALTDDLPTTQRQRIYEELALLYRRLKQPEKAVAQYERVLELTATSAYKARLEYEIGATWQEAGRAEQAANHYRAVIGRYPQENGAYEALKRLVDMPDAAVDTLMRGMVNYHAGQYKLTIEILTKYEPESLARAARAQFYIGLAHRQLKEWTLAQKTFERLIESYPGDELVPDAFFQVAYVAEISGSADAKTRALEGYDRLLNKYPRYALADIAIWRQAQLLQALQRPQEAAEKYRLISNDYPASSYAERATFLTGWVLYQTKRYEQALSAWQSKSSAQALFWSGKAQEKQGNTAEARALWSQIAQSAPDSYYGLRASALSGDSSISEILPMILAATLFDTRSFQNPDQEREEVERWLGALGGGDTLAEAGRVVHAHAYYRAGSELATLGATDQARGEFRRLREQFKDRPLALYVLALDLQERALYDQSIACAERIIALAKQPTWRKIPRYLLRLAYPAPYADLVTQEAKKAQLDPRLFFALMRQESLFDPFATSWAGARGLGQVMPATGEWIAQRLGDRSFRREDLYRPSISIRYGAWYLAQALAMFDRHIFAALAGYNGGPGNVSIWAGGLPIRDIDEFVENIGASESKTYVREIWKQYAVYCWLYPPH